jgi:hypothetical protein
VLETVASAQQEEFRVVREEVVPIKRGLHHSSFKPWNSIRVHQREALNVAKPIISQYDPGFFDEFWSQCVWAIVKVGRW